MGIGGTGAATAARVYTTNGLNRYSNVAGTGFGYDANGNLTSDGTRTFTHDVENRLVGAAPAAGGSGTVALRYDPPGRLYEVTGPAGTKRFVWDGDALADQYDGAGTLTDRFVHGNAAGVDDPLVWYDGSYTNFLHADHQGSIVGITTYYVAPRINAWDEYGVPNATNVGPFGYTGQLWLPELGMYHYKARVYAPALGRFLQTDPVGYEGGVNLYAYVGNDPVNSVDPTGNATCTGTPEHCGKVREYATQVRRAARLASITNGSRIPTSYGRALTNISNKIDSSGVSILAMRLDRGVLGTSSLSDDRATVVVKLDVDQIEGASGFATGAGILGHETQHGLDRLRYGDPNTSLYDVFWREFRGNFAESLINQMLGQETAVWNRRMTPARRLRSIRDEAYRSCDYVSQLWFGGQPCPTQ